MKYVKKLAPIIIIAGILLTCFQRREQIRNLYQKLCDESGQPDEIDFAYWQEKNPDVYAWIRIPGTEVDYPILQHESDDSYYLTHDIDGEPNIYGAVFTERVNSKEFTDANTIVYGHNMVDGSMFGSLKKYQNEEYLEAHKEIIIFLPGETRKYQVTAAYIHSAEHLMSGEDSDTPEEVPLLTLSTCTGNDSSKRQLVQAVFISREEKE